MAWYLSEIVTDLSPLSSMLKLCTDIEPLPISKLEAERRQRLIKYMHQGFVNMDHIDGNSIPFKYKGGEFEWLAHGYNELIDKFGLLQLAVKQKSNLYHYEATKLGAQIYFNHITTTQLIREYLKYWVNDAGVRPYPLILDVAKELKNGSVYPCRGLLLLEIYFILLDLNKYKSNRNLYQLITKHRYAYKNGPIANSAADLLQYSDYLLSKIGRDYKSYFPVNYPARSTLLLMMHAEELTYGPVPDEVFGLIQYVTIT